MHYKEETFKYIGNVNKHGGGKEIQRVASILGLRPQLIAGALLEEADAQHHHSHIKDFLDKQLDQDTIEKTEQQLRDDYKAVISQGIIDNKTGLVGKWNTIVHETMRDVGRGNIRVAVAIKEMEDSLKQGTGSTLGLERYKDSYLTLVKNLHDPINATRNNPDAKPTAMVAIAGLHLQRNKTWLLERIDKKYWDSLPPENQDAILITLYNNGLSKAETIYQKQMEAYGFYRPTPGGGESGGLNHEINAKRINTLLEISNSQYGDHTLINVNNQQPILE